jgi:hypothetical protein
MRRSIPAIIDFNPLSSKIFTAILIRDLFARCLRPNFFIIGKTRNYYAAHWTNIHGDDPL